ncbi:hypothetical protein ACFL0Z_02365 [Patescibacteria group bacterium]
MEDKKYWRGHIELWLNFLLRNTVIIVQLFSQVAFSIYLAVRSILGAGVLWVVLLSSKSSAKVTRQQLPTLIWTSVFLWLAMVIIFAGVAIEKAAGGNIGQVIVPAVSMGLLAFTVGPIVTGDRWNRYAWPAFLFGFAGTVCVLYPKIGMPKLWLGPGFGVVAGACFSAYLITLRQANISKVSALVISLWQQTICALGFILVPIVLILLGWLIPNFGAKLMTLWNELTVGMSPINKWGSRQYLGLAWGFLVCGAAVTYFFAAANEHLGNVQLVVVLSFVEPALVAAYEMIFLGTSYHFTFWLGVPLLGCAGWLITRERERLREKP